jgi:hypothetical protein
VSIPNPRPEQDPSRPPAWEAIVLIGGCFLLVVAGVFYLRVENRPRIKVLDSAALARMTDGAYIGSRACRECHPGEHAAYTRSGHSRTLRAAGAVPLARKLDGHVAADPELPGVSWAYALREGRLQVERSERGTDERIVLDYAFGSDHHATTFVTVTDEGRPAALEHRLTHFAEGDALEVTPGQRAAKPARGATPRGRELTPEETRKCFGCHATLFAEDGAPPGPTLIPNVSCERCHGPARKHVEAARAGRTDLAMPFGLETWTTESQLRLCGQCHRHPDGAAPGLIRPDNPEIARFQPVGLMQSACYNESGGALSCVTCHDPHARATRDQATYETACLKCHAASPGASCPVSPREGCIGCHMPKVDSGQRILFTDHWIRVR